MASRMVDFQNALGERPVEPRKGDTPTLIYSDTRRRVLGVLLKDSIHFHANV